MTDTLYSQALDTDQNGWDGFTLVQRFEAAALTMPSGNILTMTVRFEAAAAEGLTITNAYIGHAAASGDAYDFSATPVQLLFSGSGSVAISAGATATSDSASFVYDKTSALLIAYYVGGGASVDSLRKKTGLSNINRYAKAANDAATVNKTGYGTEVGELDAINRIQAEVPGNGFFYFM